RAQRAFTGLAKRPDVPAGMRANLAAWNTSLASFAERKPTGPPLDAARRLVAEAQDRARYPDDRAALVVYFEASGQLHRFLDQRPASRTEQAEACYLLGVIESRVGRSAWLSQTEFLLERAIRLAPQKPFARDAYELLAEFEASSYGGAAGPHAGIPPDVQARPTARPAPVRHPQGG